MHSSEGWVKIIFCCVTLLSSCMGGEKQLLSISHQLLISCIIDHWFTETFYVKVWEFHKSLRWMKGLLTSALCDLHNCFVLTMYSLFAGQRHVFQIHERPTSSNSAKYNIAASLVPIPHLANMKKGFGVTSPNSLASSRSVKWYPREVFILQKRK